MFVRTVFLKLNIKHVLCVTIALTIIFLSGLLTHLFENDYHTNFEYPYKGDIRDSLLQLEHNEIPDITPINTYNYGYISKCEDKCTVEDSTLRLVYIIKSSPENLERRQAIRKTWGYEKRFSDVDIRTVFILGERKGTQTNIDEESLQYHDIVQANFTDSYFNNTIKTMMGIKWAVTECSNGKFYMFVDDDYYVSTRNVLRFIRNPTHYPEYVSSYKFNKDKLMEFELPDDVRLYAGYVFFSPPHRHYFSKWYVSLNDYPFHMWPPYVTAGAYVLSQRALFEMYYGSFYTQHFKFDDIYLVASHGYSPSELVKVWNEQKSVGNA
ncbi:hypothetical protein FQR65_LT07373 [Abscondita terminalis]|nr:hypothetical protein FQR65_LT07373 [Abscondita terminalis]